MSVILSIDNDVVNCNESLNFTEQTGAYDAVSNPGGWGTPNADTSDATTAKIFVWIPGATTAVEIDLFPESFPTTNTTQAYNITASVLGLGSGAVLPDGVYTVQYVVTGTFEGEVFSYNTSQTFVIICAVQCCVDKMFLALDPCGCSCGDDALMKALWAQALLEQAQHAACCGQIDNFNTLLAQVNKICAGNCSSC
jgi:hypothetical protein